MATLAANLTMMFNEVPFLERFAAAAEAGFEHVEFLFPYEHPPEVVAAAAQAAGVSVALFNAPPGDWAAGERGMAALPGREAEFREAVERALVYAAALECPQIHVMGGIMPAGADPETLRETYVLNLRHAADQAAEAGRRIVIEPLNGRDMPGYILPTTSAGRDVLEAVERPNALLQFDLYHAQISEGDLTVRLRALAPLIGHVQIAGVPDRHEPDTGETSPHYLLGILDEIGYRGCVGCEYRPRAGTKEGLGWAAPYLRPTA